MADLKNYVSFRKQKKEIYVYYKSLYSKKLLEKCFYGSLKTLKARNESKRYTNLEYDMKVKYFRNKFNKDVMSNVLNEWKFQTHRIGVLAYSLDKIRMRVAYEKVQMEMKSQDVVILHVEQKHN